MTRSLVLAVLALGACTPGSSPSVDDPELTASTTRDPWVRVKCEDSTCDKAVLTTDAVRDGTITWYLPDGTTSTGTSVTVGALDAESPKVIEVEVSYANGDVGNTFVGIAPRQKFDVLEEATDLATAMIVIEAQGGCGQVKISSIGGCFDGVNPFTFHLWEGLADPGAPAPYAALTPMSPATFDLGSGGYDLDKGGADAARAWDGLGVQHQDPEDSGIAQIAHAPPYMVIQIDQTVTPAITLRASGSTSTLDWQQAEGITFQCDGNNPLGGLASVPGN